MTLDDVKTYVEEHSDDDANSMTDSEICKMFEVVYQRPPDGKDREDGLWLLICATALA